MLHNKKEFFLEYTVMVRAPMANIQDKDITVLKMRDFKVFNLNHGVEEYAKEQLKKLNPNYHDKVDKEIDT